MSRKTIALIGGGQIGGNLALLAAQKELGNIIIFDIPKAEGMVKGKALDLMQLRPHDGYDANITGTSNWKDVKDARCLHYYCRDSQKTGYGPGRSTGN